MKDTTVAARYARALFIVTERRKETARSLEELKALAEIVRPGGRIAGFLATPEVRLADKRAALAKAMEGRALHTVRIFVDLLLRKKRLGEFAEIATQFEALVEEQLGVLRAHAVSAVALTGAELDRLRKQLERASGKTVRLTTEVDPRLLGGALVRIGNRVIDRSVHTLLEAIGKQLHEVNV